MRSTPAVEQLTLPHLIMPSLHDVRAGNAIARRLHGNLAAAADRGPEDFPELLLTPGVGARTVRALAAQQTYTLKEEPASAGRVRFPRSPLIFASAARGWPL